MSARVAIVSLLVAAPAVGAPPEIVHPEVVSTRPHDTGAYTQGLLLHDGKLYESAGGYGGNSYGPSTLREVDAQTGEVLRSVTLDGSLFAEGLARVGDHLFQLTWQEHLVIVWDITSFTEVTRHTYTGEGWGLCYDGVRLVMSNGSNQLTFRRPSDFEMLGSVDVTLESPPGTTNAVYGLNELECVGASVYANLYTTQGKWIVEIDATSGEVTRWIQAPAIHPELTDFDHVLNGIAYDAANDTFLITGKQWPDLFEVRFGATAPSDGAPSGGDPIAPGDPGLSGDASRPRGKSNSKGCSGVTPGWLPFLLLGLWRRRPPA